MTKKKSRPTEEKIQFRTSHKAHIPYAYVDPKTNFLGGNNWREQEYISDFTDGFTLGRENTFNELEQIISQLKTREIAFINLLKEKEMILSEEQDWYKLNIKKIKQKTEDESYEMLSELNSALTAFTQENTDKEKLEAQLEKQLNNNIIENTKNNLPLALQNYFSNGLSQLPSWVTPKVLFDQIAPEYQAMINEQQEVPAPLLKLISNIIAWYELPSNKKKQGTSKNSLYNKLRAYRTAINRQRKGKRSAIRKASQDIQTKSNKMNIEQMLRKMQQSVQGQANQQLGDLTEKKIKQAFIANGFNKQQIKATGKITILVDKPLADLELTLDNSNLTKEFSSTELLNVLQKNRKNLRSPKADLVIEGENDSYGLSVKSTSLKSTTDIPHKIALHHGTYISLIRFLTRYKSGIALANQLSEPGKMHAILNMVRANDEINSPSLDVAASSMVYAFMGANEGDIFTDYGQEVQDAYDGKIKSVNNVVALVDSQGNMRLISSLLQEIQQNLEKASITITFKVGGFNYITKNGELDNYTRNIVFSENFVSPQDFSSIEALVYMFSS